MRDIESIQFEVHGKAVRPTLLVRLQLKRHDGREALLGVSGGLCCPHDTLVAPLFEWNPASMNDEQLLRSSSGDDRAEASRSTWITLGAQLGRCELDHIEDIRNKNRKGDVDFRVQLTVRSLVLQAGGLPLVDLEITKGQPRVLAGSREPTNVTALIEKTGGGFGKVVTETADGSRRIPANDWLHDYAPKLGIGSFIVCEIPQPSSVSPEPGERLAKAMVAVSRAREALLAGDWSGVIKELRPSWEPLRNYPALQDMLKKDGYDEAAARSFNAALGNLFDLASKFSHALERDQVTVRPDLIAQKEDAYLVYCSTLSVLNLIARKARRLDLLI